MTEFDRNTEEAFTQTFDTLFDLAVENHRRETWFAMPPASHAQDWNARVMTYVRSDTSISPYRPPTYQYYDLHTPEDVHTTTRRLAETERIGGYAGHPEVEQLIPIRVAVALARRAPTLDGLIRVTSRFSQWAAEQQIPHGSEIVTSTGVLMRRSFGLGAYSDPETALRFAQSLAPTNPDTPRSEAFTSAMSDRLGQIIGLPGVLDNNDLPPRDLREVEPRHIITAIRAFDAAGILSDSFWGGFAVTARGAIRLPELLPLVYQKIVTETNPDILESLPANPDQFAADYAAQLLRAYARDPSRNTKNVAAIQNFVRRDKRIAGSVDPRQLVVLANHLVDELNTRRTAEGSAMPEELMQRLDPNDPLHVSDALVRVLQITRRDDLDQVTRTRQFEQDVLHAEIISMVRERTVREARARALAAVALQYPGATPAQLEAAREQVRDGLPLSEVVRLFSDPS